MIQQTIVAFVPPFETSANIVARCSRLKAHERIRKIIAFEVVLRRKIIRLGLGIASDAARELFRLVEVVRNWAEVVEELAEHVPAAALAHHVGAQEFIADLFDRLLEEYAAALGVDVAETFVFGRARTVIGTR